MDNIFVCSAKNNQNNFLTSIHRWHLYLFLIEKTFFFTPRYSFMSRFFFSFMFLPGRGVISGKDVFYLSLSETCDTKLKIKVFTQFMIKT